MNIQGAVQSQYLAALKMLKEAIVKCPPSVWDPPRDRDKIWFRAYHTLYWTHKYLQARRKDFVAWKGRGNANDWAGKRSSTGASAISQEELLEYLAFVEQEVTRRVAATNFAASSGFRGFKIDKLEFALVNIRHIQQHTGEIYERVGSRVRLTRSWVEHVRRKVQRQEKGVSRMPGTSKIQAAVQSQLRASLQMLREAIAKCPPAVWDTPQDKDRFWYRAQHALYWAQVDLRHSLKSFVPRRGLKEPQAQKPVSKEELLDTLAYLEWQVASHPAVGSAAVPAFRPDELERMIADIRHIQQHTGELYERLGTRADVKLRWFEHVHRKRK
jgi:hypothetical protein